MKRLLLFILFAGLGSFLFAQTPVCQPDSLYKDSTAGVYPTPAVGINKVACIGKPFSFTFTIVVPDNFLFSGIQLPLNYVKLDTLTAIDSLPKGITYKCNPPNCIFQKNTRGCAVLTGTPTAANAAPKDYNLKIKAEISSAAFPTPLAVEFPGPLFPGQYKIALEPANSAKCSSTGLVELGEVPFEINVVPNPFSDFTQFTINTTESGEYQFRVMDNTGRMVHERMVRIEAGETKLSFDGSTLPNGMYFYAIQRNNYTVSGKLMILH